MSAHDLSAANPYPGAAVGRLAVEDAERAMREAIVTLPRDVTVKPAARRGARRGRAAGLAVAAVIVALALVLPSGDRAPGGADEAYAAEVVRFAEASPLVLLELPDWRVDSVGAASVQSGGMRFRSGSAPLQDAETQSLAERQRQATLAWLPVPLDESISKIASSTIRRGRLPVLGTTAQVFVYGHGVAGNYEITALWSDSGLTLEYRAAVPDLAAFADQLAALHRVDSRTWLDAMPDNVIEAADQSTTVLTMLRGIPLPPGFTAGDVSVPPFTMDRSLVATAVAGTVGCRWLDRWSDARRTGDTAAAQQAIAAMATARDWPVLTELAKTSLYPEGLIEYAEAMPSGRWYGRPLETAANGGLACFAYGGALTSP